MKSTGTTVSSELFGLQQGAETDEKHTDHQRQQRDLEEAEEPLSIFNKRPHMTICQIRCVNCISSSALF